MKTKASHIPGKPGECDTRKGKPREENVTRRKERPFVSSTAAKMSSYNSSVLMMAT